MKSQLEKDKIEFIKQLSNISIKEMDRLADNGHKIISIEEIGNVSRVRSLCNLFDKIGNLNLYLQNSVQNIIKITAGRFNNLNKKKEIEEFPEKSDTINDFFVSFVMYKIVLIHLYMYLYNLFYRFMMYVKLKLIRREIMHTKL